MKAGTVSLLRFPQTDLRVSKLRPVLLVARAPGTHPDWLVAMVSAQIELATPELDELIGIGDGDFEPSGLKKASVIRIGRLAVVEQSLLMGELGAISDERLRRVRCRVAEWVLGEQGVAR